MLDTAVKNHPFEFEVKVENLVFSCNIVLCIDIFLDINLTKLSKLSAFLGAKLFYN